MKPVRTFGPVRGLPALPRNVAKLVEQNAKALSNVSFGTTNSNTDSDMNVQCWKATGTTPGTANTQFSVSHGLKHKPFGFIVVGTSGAAHIFASNVPGWTAATNTSQGVILLMSDQINIGFSLIII